MEEVERSAASVEEAIEAALDELGLSEQEAHIEILQEPEFLEVRRAVQQAVELAELALDGRRQLDVVVPRGAGEIHRINRGIGSASFADRVVGLLELGHRASEQHDHRMRRNSQKFSLGGSSTITLGLTYSRHNRQRTSYWRLHVGGAMRLVKRWLIARSATV